MHLEEGEKIILAVSYNVSLLYLHHISLGPLLLHCHMYSTNHKITVQPPLSDSHPHKLQALLINFTPKLDIICSIPPNRVHKNDEEQRQDKKRNKEINVKELCTRIHMHETNSCRLLIIMATKQHIFHCLNMPHLRIATEYTHNTHDQTITPYST